MHATLSLYLIYIFKDTEIAKTCLIISSYSLISSAETAIAKAVNTMNILL